MMNIKSRPPASQKTKKPSPALSVANILAMLAIVSLMPIQAQAYAEQGRLNDAASWRSDEFKLNWGLGAIGADYAYARGLSGSGVRLGVFDTGTDLRHGEFSGKEHYGLRLSERGCTSETASRIGDGCYFTEGDRAQVLYLDSAVRYEDHGTHVAGTMVANRDGNGTHGVAYASDLSAIRLTMNLFCVGGEFLGGREVQSAQIHAAYAQLREQNARVVNHSWSSGSQLTEAELDEELAQVYNAGNDLGQGSRDFGILQIWAAGNTNIANVSPENAPLASTEASLPRILPELERYWLSVVNLRQDLTLDLSSNRCGFSKEWCLAAPGTDITSTTVSGDIQTTLSYGADGKPNELKVTGDRPDFDYSEGTGTSFAAPQVSGGLALLIERFPYLDNPQIRDVLLTTATDLGAPGVDDVYGWGMMNLKKAIDGPGQLRVDTDVNMDRYAGGTKVWQGSAWDDWRNDIGGPGRLGKSGVGWLRLSGENSFAGATLTQGILELDGVNRLSSDVKVEGGALILNGTLHNTDLNVSAGLAQINGSQTGANTLVGAKGTLMGAGTLASTRVEGTIMPGSDRQALNINGDYQQVTGSTLVALSHANPEQPALSVTGQARVDGGTLRMVRQDGALPLGQRYTILYADNGVNGGFTSIDHSTLSPFLSFNQLLDANNLWVDVGRGRSLASAANTANQRAVADAADREAISGPLPQRLTALFAEQAPHALDQLSGELHASSQAVLIDNSRIVRDAALDRARSTPGMRSREPQAQRSGAWVQLPRQSGAAGGDGNTARTAHTTTGLLVGVDHALEQGTRMGVVRGSDNTDVKAGSRGKASIDSYQIGLHVGHAWDAFGLYAGTAYGQHAIQTRRRVNFPGINERLSADYSARTLQLFTEANYRFDQGAWDWQPYVQLAQVRQRSDGFSERGGVSALKGKGSKETVNLTTGGMRFNIDLDKTQIGPSWLSLHGGAAYTLASGDLQPTTEAAWAGGANLQVGGAPLNRRTTHLELGATASLTRDSSLELRLSQERGERLRDQNITARYSFNF